MREMLSPENMENLRALVKRGVEAHTRDGVTPEFRVMTNEVPVIHDLMKAHPGIGYRVQYPSPYEARGNRKE